MDCVACGSAALMKRPDRTARGYRRFRCRECGKQFNERNGGLLNHTQYPSDMIALVVLWRVRYPLNPRDPAGMFLQRGIVFSHEAVRAWEAKLVPVLTQALRRRRHSAGVVTVRAGCVRGTGMSMKPTSKSVAAGRTCTGPSTATANSSTRC